VRTATSTEALTDDALRDRERRLRDAIDDRLRNGWSRADLDHVVPRGLERLARELWAALGEGLVEWRVRRGVRIEAAVRVADFLLVLVQLLRPLPSTNGAAPTSDADPAMLVKVRGLLAKAESTIFPAEAEALTAKAHELMTRHAIDRAIVAGETPEGGVVARRVYLHDPYQKQRFLLLSAVADSSGCRVIWWSGLGIATVFGHASDAENADLLYTSLLLQALRGMAAARPEWEEGRNATAAFRRAYLFGFARQIGSRLAKSRVDTVREAEQVHGESLLPVLASRDAAVEAAVEVAAPRARNVRAQVSNIDGLVAGRRAADRATLANQSNLPTSRRQLGR
jgi:hypothetical protein